MITQRVQKTPANVWLRGQSLFTFELFSDDVVAESLGLRPDVPADTLQGLLAKTTDVVRARLLKGSSPAVRDKVQAALNAMPAPASRKPPGHDDLAEARAAVIALNKTGKLNDSSVNRFAIRREYPNVIAALSLLSGASVHVARPACSTETSRSLATTRVPTASASPLLWPWSRSTWPASI